MIYRLFLIVFLLSADAFSAPNAELNIAVSIKPLYGIVSALTHGVTTPTLLIKNQASAHHFHLQPSQLSQLNSADLIVFVHPDFEAGFKKILNNIKPDKKIMLSANNNNHHLWLDVDKIIKFSQQLSEKLIQIDSVNQTTYLTNLATLTQALQMLNNNIKQQLAIHQNKQVVGFSNALDYFLDANHLKHSIVVSHYHGAKLSLFKLLKIKKSIKKSKPKCLLSTTQVPKKSIQTLTEGLDINTQSVDIIGDGDYFKLMTNLTNQVNQCLK